MKRFRGPRSQNRPLVGRVGVPGDKSISHRALILGALAHGRSRLEGLNPGQDVESTRGVLTGLGVAIEGTNGDVDVEGCGWRVREPAAPLDCGNSGTTLRTMAGVLAGAEGAFLLVGDESLARRPMLRVVAPLRQMGATIDGREYGDRAPLFIRGSELSGCEHELLVASAQVKTALLLAGLRAHGRTTVTEPAASRDHTERMLAAAGVEVALTGDSAAVEGPADLSPLDVQVPGDPSAAAFLVTAATMLGGSVLEVADVGVNPTRIGFTDVLRRMGADLSVEEESPRAGEPCGTIVARASELRSVHVDPSEIPRLIDEIPILAVAATQAEGTTTFEGIGELRVKESDRAAAIVTELRSLGARIELAGSTLAVTGPTKLQGATVDSHGDHRMAMALAVAGLLTTEKVTVRGWSAVDVSFPDFLATLEEARS